MKGLTLMPNTKPQFNMTTAQYRYHSLLNTLKFNGASAIVLVLFSIVTGQLVTFTMALFAIIKGYERKANYSIEFANKIVLSGWIILALSALISLFLYYLY